MLKFKFLTMYLCSGPLSGCLHPCRIVIRIAGVILVWVAWSVYGPLRCVLVDLCNHSTYRLKVCRSCSSVSVMRTFCLCSHPWMYAWCITTQLFSLYLFLRSYLHCTLQLVVVCTHEYVMFLMKQVFFACTRAKFGWLCRAAVGTAAFSQTACTP